MTARRMVDAGFAMAVMGNQNSMLAGTGDQTDRPIPACPCRGPGAQNNRANIRRS